MRAFFVITAKAKDDKYYRACVKDFGSQVEAESWMALMYGEYRGEDVTFRVEEWYEPKAGS